MPANPPTLPSLDAVAAIARAAGDAILAIYGREFGVMAKSDASPLTEADEAAEALIVPALQALTPGWPVVAEEAVARGQAPEAVMPGACWWLVDPLDGTREFVARNGEFTVNIGLVRDGAPVLGVVLAPALGVLYAGAQGQGAWVEDAAGRRPLAARTLPAAGATLALSRSHGDAERLAQWLRDSGWQGRVAGERHAGSALKFGLIAAGEADLYPRLGPTMEWDTAAGQAVLEAAGGAVRDLHGAPLRYGKPLWRNPHFVAGGRS
jgi:3'(2'), 5'-bisphosphate nucleotidase